MLVLSLAATGSSAAEPRNREKGLFEFRDGDRVVFLGSGFIERLQNTGYLETMLTAAMPSKNITFRNLGWSGDTVWGDARAVFGSRADGFKRLLSDVALCKPTVLIVCYGENEAYAGETGLEEFRSGMNTLLDSLEATGARIVLLGPRQHEKMKPPLPDPAKYNAVLRKYNDVIGQVAKERGHGFIDLYEANVFDAGEGPFFLTDNGIHYHSTGDFFVSRQLARSFGIPSRFPRVTIDVIAKSYDATYAVLTEVEFNPPSVKFEVDTHHLLDDGVNSPLLTFWNLPAGEYELFIDGKKNSSREENYFSFPRSYVVSESGNRTEQMRQLINEKNTLFFHRYRPQNETYLFLFRKHEQGNNAVEIPQFDPLIADLEKKIAELKQPVKQKYELIKVK